MLYLIKNLIPYQTMSNPGHHQDQNQQLLILIGFLLLIIIVVFLIIFGIIFYLLYTGTITISGLKISKVNKSNKNSIEHTKNNEINNKLPDITLTPLERKIIETIVDGHKIKQSDLPNLLNASKSKISEALSNLEDKRVIERFKAGRSLEIRYVYKK